MVTAFGYDALNRQVEVMTESDGGARITGQTTAYNALGQVESVTNALGQTTHTAYDPQGNVVAIWGATYPVAYEYDEQGRMVAMATTRDPAHESVNLLTLLPEGVALSDTSHASYPSQLDVTRWLYDAPTGLLTQVPQFEVKNG